jgi:hypothetical protein
MSNKLAIEQFLSKFLDITKIKKVPIIVYYLRLSELFGPSGATRTPGLLNPNHLEM